MTTSTIPPPRRNRRIVPMQVLSLGLCRTGTASMRMALEKLGYLRTCHGFDVDGRPHTTDPWIALVDAKIGGRPVTKEMLDEALWDCMAVTDTPSCCFAEELVEAYPEAKIILVDRNFDAWYKSFEPAATMVTSWKMTLGHNLIEEPLGLVTGSFFQRLYRWYFRGSNPAAVLANARNVYTEHNTLVKRLVPKERLLVYNLGDGWGPLCEFLGKDVPKEGFPRVNDAAALMEKAKNEMVWKSRAAMRVWAWRGLSVLGFLLALYYRSLIS